MVGGEKGVVFGRIEIDGQPYRRLLGVMYAKPSPDTVLASLHALDETSDPGLAAGRTIALTARTEAPAYAWMRGIKARVIRATPSPGGGMWYYLELQRKRKTPG